MTRQQFLGSLAEERLVIETCQAIKSKLIDHGRIFPKANRAGYAVQKDFSFVGLCNEILSAVSQCSYFIGVTVALSGYDDRNCR